MWHTPNEWPTVEAWRLDRDRGGDREAIETLVLIRVAFGNAWVLDLETPRAGALNNPNFIFGVGLRLD